MSDRHALPPNAPGGGAAASGGAAELAELSAVAAALAPLSDLARDRLPPAAAPEEARAGYLRLERVRTQRAAVRRWRFLPVAVTAAGATAVVLAVLRLSAPAPLAVVVDGGAVEPGGYLRVPAERGSSLRFSDGTVVELERASRLRIVATSDKGARLLLDDGRARARVVPKRGAKWLFDAGPCRIHVTGTRFDMRWSASEQILDVWLWDGSVTVEGPPATAGVGMHEGQHLTMDLRQSTVRLDTIPSLSPPSPSPSPSESPSPAEAPPPAAAPAVVPVPAPARAAAPAPRALESWTSRVSTGEFRGVIADAERRGIARVLARESAADVMALGDAARYAGQTGLARRALKTLRARFPASAPAHRAAFLLGRIAEDQDADLRKALAWYDGYLADGSDDVYRAEALGRQMAATLHVHGAARARPLAAAYLRQYPRGAYAEAARALVAP